MKKREKWVSLLVSEMLWLVLVTAAAACLTRVKPGSQPLEGSVGDLQVNLTNCWKPCLLSFPICHPLCPAYTIEEARMQKNLTDEAMVPENLHQEKLVRLEAERRLAIRYFCDLNILQKNGYDNVNHFQETSGSTGEDARHSCLLGHLASHVS